MSLYNVSNMFQMSPGFPGFDPEAYSHPKVAKEWHWLNGMAEIVMSFQCEAFLENVAPEGQNGLTAGLLCLEGAACKCDTWGRVYTT